MFYALSWFVVFSLLALWSLAAWAFHAITTWAASNAGVLAGGSGAAQGLRVPDWLAPWMPPELALAVASMAVGSHAGHRSRAGMGTRLGGRTVGGGLGGLGHRERPPRRPGLVLSGLITVLRRRESRKTIPSMVTETSR